MFRKCPSHANTASNQKFSMQGWLIEGRCLKLSLMNKLNNAGEVDFVNLVVCKRYIHIYIDMPHD